MSWISCHLSGFVLFLSEFWAQNCSCQAPLGRWWQLSFYRFSAHDTWGAGRFHSHETWKVGPTPGIAHWHAVLWILHVLVWNSSRSLWFFQWNLHWELHSCRRLALSWAEHFSGLITSWHPRGLSKRSKESRAMLGPFSPENMTGKFGIC